MRQLRERRREHCGGHRRHRLLLLPFVSVSPPELSALPLGLLPPLGPALRRRQLLALLLLLLPPLAMAERTC